jgi:hypothetical protein
LLNGNPFPIVRSLLKTSSRLVCIAIVVAKAPAYHRCFAASPSARFSLE